MLLYIQYTYVLNINQMEGFEKENEKKNIIKKVSLRNETIGVKIPVICGLFKHQMKHKRIILLQ